MRRSGERKIDEIMFVKSNEAKAKFIVIELKLRRNKFLG
jgi:hypothetical protein